MKPLQISPLYDLVKGALLKNATHTVMGDTRRKETLMERIGNTLLLM